MTDLGGMDYSPRRNPETGREILPNPERLCGYKKHGSGYIRSETHPNGILPPFVEFDPYIPHKEGVPRSYERFPGVQFEQAVTPTAERTGDGERHRSEYRYPEDAEGYRTDPPGEVHNLMASLDGQETDVEQFGYMVTGRANDLLMGVGKSYYPEPEDFIREVRQFGLSKGIPISKNQSPPPINPGKTRVYLVHPRAIPVWDEDVDPSDPETEPVDYTPGFIGYVYLTRAVWTVPRDGKVPRWAEKYAETGQMDICEVGEKVPQEEWQESIGEDPIRPDDYHSAVGQDGPPLQVRLRRLEFQQLRTLAGESGVSAGKNPSKDQLIGALSDAEVAPEDYGIEPANGDGGN